MLSLEGLRIAQMKPRSKVAKMLKAFNECIILVEGLIARVRADEQLRLPFADENKAQAIVGSL